MVKSSGDYGINGRIAAPKRDINFLWLLAGQKAPDYSTIARFRSGFLEEACENLFYLMVHRLERAGELSKETFFLDGTKLETCANKYTFIWKKSVEKWEEKMFSKIQEAVRLVNQKFIQSFRVGTEYRVQDLRKICRFLEEICRERNIEFVRGHGKHKSIEQRYLELFQRYLERQTTYDWHTASFQGRNNYCKTDPDATFMHMKDDHMRNAQLKLGFNDPSATADSEYESEEGYSYLREEGQQLYIKLQAYEKWKKRSFKQDIGKWENMGYNQESDTYVCHAGKELRVVYLKSSAAKVGLR